MPVTTLTVNVALNFQANTRALQAAQQQMNGLLGVMKSLGEIFVFNKMLDGIESAITATGRLIDKMGDLKRMQFSPEQQKQALDTGFNTAQNTPGTTWSGNLGAMTDLFAAFRNRDEAI